MRGTLILAVASVFLFSGFSRADDAAELGLAYAAAQQENLDRLKAYRWNTHTTMKSEGETKFDFTVANRLNEKGEMVSEVEESESTVRKKRGVRGRRQRKSVVALDELLGEIGTVASSYIFMSKGQEVDFFDRAKITDGEDELAGMKIVRATDVSLDGDMLQKTIDPETLRPKKIEFRFVLEDHAVEGEVMYRPIEDGPNVPRLSTIRISDLDGLVETEFIDYEKQL